MQSIFTLYTRHIFALMPGRSVKSPGAFLADKARIFHPFVEGPGFVCSNSACEQLSSRGGAFQHITAVQ